MNLERVDLNLLVYLDVLLREKNVTRAAEQLGITQPALSNGLRRLRDLFNDPLLIRSSSGMTPTERALELQPRLREILGSLNQMMEPKQEFRPLSSNRVFRIMVSDYAEATLMPALVKALRSEAPDVVLDCLTPSDVSVQDIEQGKVDLAINRFNEIPQTFHQVTLWSDSFSCLINRGNPAALRFNLKTYLDAQHIWVSKTGMGVGVGMDPDRSRLGQIDAALPSRIAMLQGSHPQLVIKDPPFHIPEFELKMAWGPLLHHSPAHRWLRQLIVYVARQVSALEAQADDGLDLRARRNARLRRDRE